MNNLQALNYLKAFGERQKAEQERLIKEILQENLQNLKENFKKEYRESLNTIENEIKKQIIYKEDNIIKLSKESENRIQAELKKIHEQVKTTQENFKENIKTQSQEPIKFKLTTILYSFICGILIAIIFFLIAWYQWIKPYQISKQKTVTTESGQVFIQMSEEELIKQDNKFYFKIQ